MTEPFKTVSQANPMNFKIRESVMRKKGNKVSFFLAHTVDLKTNLFEEFRKRQGQERADTRKSNQKC